MTTANLHTEHVTQAQHDPRHPGRVINRTFWIVYGDNEATFGHVDDRISRAWASGRTRKEALAALAAR